MASSAKSESVTELSRTNQIVVLKIEGSTVTDPMEIAWEMMNGLLPNNILIVEDEKLSEVRRQAKTAVIAYESPRVTMEDLRQKNDKIPGHDGMRAEIIKKAYSRISVVLLNTVNDDLLKRFFLEHGSKEC